MAVSYVSTGAFISAGGGSTGATASVTPNLPASLVTTNRAFIGTVSTGAVSAPAGWSTLFAATQLGGGTAGGLTGPRYVSVFYRDKDASWSTMPLVTAAGVAGVTPSIAAFSMAMAKGASDVWATPTVGSGSNATSGTSYAITTNSFTTDTGGLLALLYAWPGNPSTLSGLSVSGSGGSYGSNTSRVGVNGETLGNDSYLAVWTYPVTTGTTAAHSITLTGTSSRTSGAVLINQGITSGVDVAPDAAGSAATAQAPTVTFGAISAAPDAAGSAATAQAPTVGLGALPVAPGVVGTAAAAQAPTVTPGAISVAPGVVGTAATAPAPTVTPTLGVAPAVVGSAATAQAPSVTLSPPTLHPDGPVGSAATAQAPAVTFGAISVAPDAAGSAATAQTPTVSLILAVAPDTAGTAAAAQAPSVTFGAIGTEPDTAGTAATAQAPSVSPGAITISPPLLTSTGSVYDPVVTLGALTVSPDVVGNEAVALDPQVKGHEIVFAYLGSGPPDPWDPRHPKKWTGSAWVSAPIAVLD